MALQYIRGFLGILFLVPLVTSSGLVLVVSASLLATIFTNFSLVFGKDGSDQMLLVILVGFLVAQIGHLSGNEILMRAGIWFIAIDVSIAYLTAGIAKLYGENWRKGEALRQILSTRTYGSLVARRLMANDAVARSLNWLVIGFEIGFPLSLTLYPVGTFSMLGLGLLFHIGIAFMMGLNTFLWSFVATYPAIIYGGTVIAS
jgi:hypothetical protein